MSGSIVRSVQQIKGDLRSIIAPSQLRRLCQAARYAWRDRILGPVETICLFIAQVLHGNTNRELAVFGIVYNAVRLVMIHGAEAHGVPPDRISFIDILHWLELGCPGRGLPPFIVNPTRSRSSAPRVVRRRHKGHTYMTRPRKPQAKLLVNQELSPN